MTGKRAASYVRRSALDKRGDDASPQAQHEANHALIERMGWAHDCAADDYVDDDYSASAFATVERPDWTRMEATGDRYGTVVVFTADRYSRTLEEHVAARAALRNGGRTLALSSEGGEQTDAMGYVLRGLMAEATSDSISTHVTASRKRSRANGLPHGRAPFGYRLVKADEEPAGGPIPVGQGHGKVVGYTVDPEAALVAREVFRRLAAGAAVASVTKWMNEQGVTPPSGEWHECNKRCRRQHGEDCPRKGQRNLWSDTTVRCWVRRPSLAGRVAHDSGWRDRTTNRHADELADEHGNPVRYVIWQDGSPDGEPLIDPDLWDAVIAQVGNGGPRKAPRRMQRPTLLAGLARCAECGRPMAGRGNVYACKAKNRIGAMACPGNAISRPSLDAIVLGWLDEKLPHAVKLAHDMVAEVEAQQTTDDLRSRVAKAKHAVDYWHRKLERAVDAGEDEDVVTDIEATHERKVREYRAVKDEATRVALPPQARALLDPSYAVMDVHELERDEQRQLAELLVDKLEVAKAPALTPSHPRYPADGDGRAIIDPERVGIVSRFRGPDA